MNDEAGILWGIYKNNEPAGDGDTVTPQIVPLAYAGEDCKAPVRALLKHGEDKKGAYFYPGPSELPGGDIFEGATITFWKVGSEGKVAYSPHYKYVDIEEDMTFVGVETFDECVATLTSKDPTDPDKTRTIAFADVKDALNTAKAEAANMDDIQIDVVGDCSLASGTYTIPANAVMTVTDGKTLTITKNANIINKGTFTCAEGSTVEKRGTMNNTGTINVNGTFEIG